MTHGEQKAVLAGLYKAAKKVIREAIPLRATYSYESSASGDMGWQLNVDSKWYRHIIFLRIEGDKLEVSCEDDDDYLELANPEIVTQLVNLIFKHFPAEAWPS